MKGMDRGKKNILGIEWRRIGRGGVGARFKASIWLPCVISSGGWLSYDLRSWLAVPGATLRVGAVLDSGLDLHSVQKM